MIWYRENTLNTLHADRDCAIRRAGGVYGVHTIGELATESLARADKCPHCTNPFKIGDRALDSQGREVEIRGFHVEDDVVFAHVFYLNGDGPLNVLGRMLGTEDEPIWDRRVLPGMVVPSAAEGGDYWNASTWVVEEGLRPIA